jgi:hypothetical protein
LGLFQSQTVVSDILLELFLSLDRNSLRLSVLFWRSTRIALLQLVGQIRNASNESNFFLCPAILAVFQFFLGLGEIFVFVDAPFE